VDMKLTESAAKKAMRASEDAFSLAPRQCGL